MRHLKKLLGPLLGLLCFGQAAVARTQPIVMNWSKTETLAGVPELTYHKIQPTANGNFVVAGYARNNERYSPIVALVNPAGTFLWRRFFSEGKTDAFYFPRPVKELRVMPNGEILAVVLINDEFQVAYLSPTTGTVIRSISPLSGLGGAPNTRQSFAKPDGTVYLVYEDWFPYNLVLPSKYFWKGAELRSQVIQVSPSLGIKRTSLGTYEGNLKEYTPGGSATLGFLNVGDFHYELVSNSSGDYLVYGRIYSKEPKAPNAATVKGHQSLCARLTDQPLIVGKIFDKSISYSPGYVGMTKEGRPAIIHQSDSWSNYEMITFNSSGTWDQSSFTSSNLPVLYTNQVSQNGFIYRGLAKEIGGFDDYGNSIAKFSSNGLVNLWTIGNGPYHRLPWQIVEANASAFDDFDLSISRYLDSTGAQTDKTVFPTRLGDVYGIAQDSVTGNIVVIGREWPESGFSDDNTFIARFSQAPTATSDAYASKRNTPLVAQSVYRNDRFATGCTISIGTSPKNGTVTLRADGTFTYVPRANYVGSDSFTYRIIRPGVPVNSTATVFISITP